MVNLSAAYVEAKKLIDQFGRISADELASNLDIAVWPRNFEKQNGVYTIVEGYKYVFIKADLSEEMHNIVLFHEIGHDRLHQNVISEKKTLIDNDFLSCKTDIMEQEANLFAAEMMISDEDVIECINLGYDVKQTASNLNVNVNLVALKIAELNRRGYKFNEQEYTGKFLKAQ